MKKLAILLFALGACALANADPASDQKQEYEFTMCMAKRGVQPAAMTNDDVAACNAEAGVVDPGAGARKLSLEAWHNCLLVNATQLDDGISPAADVGRVVIQACKSEWRDWVAAQAMTERTKSKMLGRFDQLALDEGSRAVLLVRRAVKEKKPSAPSR